MTLFFYNLAIALVYPVYWMIIRFSTGNSPAKKFDQSRKDSLESLKSFFSHQKNRGAIWLHAASEGELDQALGLVREIRSRNPQATVVVSVFSLSVKRMKTEDHRNPAQIDLMFYLPLDFLNNWFAVIPLIRPIAFVSMTWDAFPNLLFALEFLQVPRFLCNAAIKKDSRRLKNPVVRHFYREVYSRFSAIGSADRSNASAFQKLHKNPAAIQATGDTRFDTILYKSNHASMDADSESRFASIRGNYFILGSTYAACDAMIFPLLPGLLSDYSRWKVLIFPHHTDETRLQELEGGLKREGLSSVRFSTADPKTIFRSRIIVMDRMGLLALAYKKSKFAYVGGAFHHRVHNTGEPAVFANPILTGPKIDASPVALDLEKQEVLARCQNSRELDRGMRMLMESGEIRKELGLRARNYIRSRAGASKQFFDRYLSEIL